MSSVSTFGHETRPIVFSSRPLLILPVKLLVVLLLFPFPIALVPRMVVLTRVAVARVVFALVEETLMFPVSLGAVVPVLGKVQVASGIVPSGSLSLIALLLERKQCKKQ